MTNTVYVGSWIFNRRCSKTLRQKPVSEHIVVEVRVIIAPEEFDAVQATLKARDPRVTARGSSPARSLTGLATCATCGGVMT
nr:recombinase family protein [Pseudorhodoplanes sinuspersici]